MSIYQIVLPLGVDSNLLIFHSFVCPTITFMIKRLLKYIAFQKQISSLKVMVSKVCKMETLPTMGKPYPGKKNRI